MHDMLGAHCISFPCCCFAAPCIPESAIDSELRCARNGDFLPRQCRRLESRELQCRCVDRMGTMIAGTSERTVDSREALDCSNESYTLCNQFGGGGGEVGVT